MRERPLENQASLYRGLTYSDPFGLCPTGPEKCSWFGNLFAGFHAGVQGLTNIPTAVDQTSFAYQYGHAAGSIVGGLTHPYDHLDPTIAAGFQNIPVGKGSVRVGRDQYQVHAEIGGGGEGQVHVQSVNGPNKGVKYTNPSEMPRALRDNEEIQRRIQRAQETLEKLRQSGP